MSAPLMFDSALQMLKDSRPFILYLRSFEQDWEPVHESWWRVLLLPVPFVRRRYSVEPERAIAPVLRTQGPFVALADPRKPVTDIGAGRLAFAEKDWQCSVRSLAKAASNVFIRLDRFSPGVLWELDEVFRRAALNKTSFLLVGRDGEPLRADIYELIRNHISRSFEVLLPEQRARGTFLYRARDGQFKWIESDRNRGALRRATIELLNDIRPTDKVKFGPSYLLTGLESFFGFYLDEFVPLRFDLGILLALFLFFLFVFAAVVVVLESATVPMPI